MTLDILQNLWFLVIYVASVFYVMLDGFDLGVGCLHLFAKKDVYRRTFLNAIGPVWDGNAVWIVIVGGALFAGFPDIYASVFSGFYTLTMILLLGFIFRAVAIEFRSKNPSKLWRNAWDTSFSLASLIIAFGIGLVLGNLILGVPLNANKEFIGTFWGFFHPYTICVGLFTISLLSMHGAIFLMMKTEGELYEKVRRWIIPSIVFFLIFYLATSIATFSYVPYMVERMKANPLLYLFPLLTLVSIACIPLLIYKKRDGLAFIFSCLSIIFLFTLLGIGTYPNIVRSSIDPQNLSLTLHDTSSSATTLKILLTIVAIGIPLVLAYGYYVYRTFRGKVKLDSTSY